MHIQPQMPQFVTWESGTRMPGSTRPFTAVLPWYEEADFAELSAIAGHERQDYQLWYRNAMQMVDDLLREGKAIEFVMIRPAAYLAWLRGRPNAPDMRRRYAEHLAMVSHADV
jgi:hypothetical protein